MSKLKASPRTWRTTDGVTYPVTVFRIEPKDAK
jgi:hypothetical protein